MLTLCTEKNGQPWCAACFYAYGEEQNLFFYTSDHSTRHATEALQNKKVAANIVLETQIVGKIQGLQIAGITYPAEGALLDIAKKRYLRRFPYARMVELNLWVLDPQYMKLTDNQLGFGEKLIWKK